MLASASNHASKVRLAKNNLRLSWIRKYANLSGQEIARLIDESFVSFAGRPNEKCRKYDEVMSQFLDLGVSKVVETGLHLSDLQRATKLAMDLVLEQLEGRKRMVRKFEEISQIGTIAANGDRKIGELIAKAFEKAGTRGIFKVSDEQTSDIELEVLDIMLLDWLPLSPIFLTDSNEVKFIRKYQILENPLVLIFEGKICNKNIVEQAITMAGDRHLLIVVEHVEDTVAGFFFLEKRLTKACVVRPPKYCKNWKEIMQDLAIFTGSQVVTGSYGFNNILQMVGSCKKVQVSEKEMVIYGGSGSQETIENLREQLRSSIKLGTSSDEKRLFIERLELLSRSIAIFKVGGARNFRKKESQVLNAISTAKYAVEAGILPGAGVALLHASKVLDNLQTTNSDEGIIIKLFQDALKMPLLTNAAILGFDGSLVVQKLLDQHNPDLGYDPINGEYVDVMKAGIFDVYFDLLRPMKVFGRNFIQKCESRGLNTSIRDRCNKEQEGT